MSEQFPSISIITVTLNERDKLLETISSVKAFISSNSDLSIEHVVVDGGSADGTVEKLIQFQHPTLQYCSESDKGIYDAMNKGVRMAQSDYAVFINAGDTIDMGTIPQRLKNELMKGIARQKLAGFAFSSNYQIGVFMRRVRSRQVSPSAPIMPGLHQGMIYKRLLLLSMPFDEHFRICGDYEQYARMFSAGLIFEPVDEVFSTLKAGGVSTNKPLLLYRESIKVTDRYFGLNFIKRLLTRVMLIAALLYVRVLLTSSQVVLLCKPSIKKT